MTIISRWFSQQPPDPSEKPPSDDTAAAKPGEPPAPAPASHPGEPAPEAPAPKPKLSPLAEAIQEIADKGPNPSFTILQQMCKSWIRNGVVSEKNLRTTLLSVAPQCQEKFVGHLLVENGLIIEDEILYTLSKICRIPCYNISNYEINPNALPLVTGEQARSLEALPIDLMGKVLTVAVTNPFVSLGFLKEKKVEVKKILCNREEMRTSLEIYYPPDAPAFTASYPPAGAPAAATEKTVQGDVESAFKSWSHLDNGLQPLLAKKLPPEEREFFIRSTPA